LLGQLEEDLFCLFDLNPRCGSFRYSFILCVADGGHNPLAFLYLGSQLVRDLRRLVPSPEHGQIRHQPFYQIQAEQSGQGGSENMARAFQICQCLDLFTVKEEQPRDTAGQECFDVLAPG
jgi:hypothetical protein